jgi:hypothetical protein
MLVASTVIPLLQTLVKTTSLSLLDWARVLVASFLATFWIDAMKLVRRKGATPP